MNTRHIIAIGLFQWGRGFSAAESSGRSRGGNGDD